MRAHIDAIKANLATAGHPVYFVAAPPSPVFPYFLVWSSAGDPATEVDVTGTSSDLDTVVGVTAVAGSPDGVLIMQALARAALSAPLQVVGRLCWLSLFDSQNVQVDRDVTLPGSTQHPAFGVDLYRLQSVPT